MVRKFSRIKLFGLKESKANISYFIVDKKLKKGENKYIYGFLIA